MTEYQFLINEDPTFMVEGTTLPTIDALGDVFNADLEKAFADIESATIPELNTLEILSKSLISEKNLKQWYGITINDMDSSHVEVLNCRQRTDESGILDVEANKA